MTDAFHGFKFDEIGQWSEIKLEIVEKYGTAYVKAFANAKGLRKFYIDAFSGAGKHIFHFSERESAEGAVPGESGKIVLSRADEHRLEESPFADFKKRLRSHRRRLKS